MRLLTSSKAALTHWPKRSISGFLLFSMWFTALISHFTNYPLTPIATVLGWLFVTIELPRLGRKQRPLIIILLTAGLLCVLLAWTYGSTETLLDLLDEHLKLAMLLTAITFINLAIKPEISSTHKGFRSYLSTFLGMHFFSSVANFSSIPVVGDQVMRKGKVDRLSQSILSRGFSLSVLWSPFLSITPLVLEQVPGAEMKNIYPYSIPLALTGLALTVMEARYRYKSRFNLYQGYPMKLSTLHLPIFLIASVLILTVLFPQTSTVVMVSIVAVLIPLLIILVQQGTIECSKKLHEHIFVKLAESRTEISLFLSAGLLAAGVKACISQGLISLPFTETNALVASISLIAIITIASLGINQLAVVAIFAGLLADVTTTPTLMAVSYIYATALSMFTSVFSGTNMILRVRYGCLNRDILRNQLPFTLVMIPIGITTLFFMEWIGVR